MMLTKLHVRPSELTSKLTQAASLQNITLAETNVRVFKDIENIIISN